MSNQDVKKNVPIYFYYLTISKEKDAKDNTTYGIDQIVDSFSVMLQRVLLIGDSFVLVGFKEAEWGATLSK